MKIVIISFDEPFYIPDLFGLFINKYRKDIKKILIVPPYSKKNNIISLAQRQMILMGKISFLFKSLKYIFKSLKVVLKISDRSLRLLAITNNISVEKVDNVNDKQTLKILKSIKPDIIIIQVPDILRPQVIKIPKIGIINKHASLLPLYKGVEPVFRALLGKESYVGYTFHFIDEQIDEGKKIFQKKIKVNEKDSVEDLYKKIFNSAGEELPKTIDKIKTGKYKTTKINKNNKSYPFPNKREINKFIEMGRKYY